MTLTKRLCQWSSEFGVHPQFFKWIIIFVSLLSLFSRRLTYLSDASCHVYRRLYSFNVIFFRWVMWFLLSIKFILPFAGVSIQTFQYLFFTLNFNYRTFASAIRVWSKKRFACSTISHVSPNIFLAHTSRIIWRIHVYIWTCIHRKYEFVLIPSTAVLHNTIELFRMLVPPSDWR